MSGTSANRKFNHIAVLMGGWSAEREVSLNSGTACADALEAEGYSVSRIDVGRDLAAKLEDLKPDACFNALHGRWGEDGCVQGLLEILAIPYSHSGVAASAIAMHKDQTKHILRAAQVPLADSRIATIDEALAAHVLPPPYVAKPIAEGSSVGIVIVMGAGPGGARPGGAGPGDGDKSAEGTSAPPPAIKDIPTLDGKIMVEKFVAGRELTCAVIGDKPTGIIDIVPADNLAFYDYEAKYAPGGSTHILPAQIPADITARIQDAALDAHHALGCRGVTRSDFRYDDAGGELVCLELNTQPGMTATSLVPELAADMGLSFGELVSWIIEDASVDR